MNRPMMDPTFVPDLAKAAKERAAWTPKISRALRWFGRALLTNPLAVNRPGERKYSSPIKVVVRTIACWAVCLPVIVGGIAAGFVFKGTHPVAPPMLTDPRSQGCYYESVDFIGEDGMHLTGWFVPALDARRVLEDKERALRIRGPAVVLVHDFGQTRQQMLPLVRPLHEQGIAVLLVALRGAGTDSETAQTFGVKEAKDVLAAVNAMRNRRFVDPARIAVGGAGTGANAALIAASLDPQIKALILANPVNDGSALVTKTVSPREPWLRWMKPVCLHAFEIMYGVEEKQIDCGRYVSVMKSRPVLMLNFADSFGLTDAKTTRQVQAFCRRNLHPD